MNNVQGYKNVLADKYMRDTNYILIKDTNDLDELEKQWDKFNSYLTIRQQRLADDKSIELWNMTNQQHYLLQKEKLLPKEDPAENIIQDKEDQFPTDTIGDIEDSMDDIFKSFEPLEESDDIKDKDISDSSKESISNQYTIDTNINIVGKDYTSIHNGLDELEKDFTAWNSQSHDLRKKSDDKCREIYGMSNIERYNKIKGELLRYDTPSSKVSKVSPEDETNSNDSLKTINVEESIKSIGGFVLEQYNSRKALNEKEESIIKNKHRRFNDTPYFTPQELIDLGVHGNDNFYSKTPDNDGLITKVKIPTWFDSYKDMCMDHIFEDYRKDWIDTLDMLYSDFDDIKKSGDEEKILSRKQSILDLGWNPEIPFNRKNRLKASERVSKILDDTVPKDVFISLNNIIDPGEDIMEEQADRRTHKPILLIFTQGKTPIISQGIKFVTKSSYSHASISFDPELNEVYSYNMRGENFGFIRENLSSFQDNMISVMAFFAPNNIVQTLKNKIKDFQENKTTFDLRIFFNKILHIDHKVSNNEYKQVCSTFVDTVLKSGGINLVGDIEIPDPGQLYNGAKTMPNKIIEVFQDIATKYDGKRVKRKLNLLYDQGTLAINESSRMSLPYPDTSEFQYIENLYSKMKPFKYGIYDKSSNTITTKMSNFLNIDFVLQNYKFLSPEEVEKYNGGNCSDQSNYIYDRLTNLGLECKQFFILGGFKLLKFTDIGHVFTVVHLSTGEYVYIEHAANISNGIYVYRSMHDVFNKVKDILKRNLLKPITKWDVIDITNAIPPYGHSFDEIIDYYYANGDMLERDLLNTYGLNTFDKILSYELTNESSGIYYDSNNILEEDNNMLFENLSDIPNGVTLRNATKDDGKKVKRKLNLLYDQGTLAINESTSILNEACKDIKSAREFVSKVGELAKKYDANYFIVTDGASGIHNNGNPAVRNAREKHIEWERKNNFDPDEDWSKPTNESGIYYDSNNILEEDNNMLFENLSDIPNGVTLRNATKDDTDNMFKWKMESIDKSIRNDPKVIKYIEKDVQDSIKITKMIMYKDETIGMFTTDRLEPGSDYWYIGEIYIVKEYRNKGIGTALLKDEISKHDKIKLQVAQSNHGAMKLYKSLGFEITDRNDEGKLYIMTLDKKNKPVNEDVQSLNSSESNDIYHNIDLWESGKSNVIWITGMSGSGKSTIAKEITYEYNAEYVELDNLLRAKIRNSDTIDNGLIDSYIKSVGGLYNVFPYCSNLDKVGWKDIVKEEEKYYKECDRFFDYIIKYANDHKNKKFVIEGVQISDYCIINDKFMQYVKEFPIILKMNGPIKTAYRREKRAIGIGKEKGDNFIAIFKHVATDIHKLMKGKFYIDNYNDLKRIKKYIGESVLNEVKKFPVEFDDEGNLIIYKTRTNSLSYGDEIHDSVQLLESYRNTNNQEGMKYELAKLWFIIDDIEKKMKKRNSSKIDYETLTNNRSTAINVFKTNLEYLMKLDKDFNFAHYYNSTPFSDNGIKVTGSTLKYSLKALRDIIIR